MLYILKKIDGNKIKKYIFLIFAMNFFQYIKLYTLYIKKN